MRLGIIGTGRIAKRFVQTACIDCEDIEIECVYNPRIESAERFAREYNILSYTNSFAQLCEKVDAVYIASPHETHFSYAAKLLDQGKHILCEKPLALKKEEAKELFRIATEKNCVLMEAIKTAYCPGFLALIEKVGSGCIGEIKDVEASFTRLTDTSLREYQDADFGGSFIEFGSYVMMPALKLLGTEFCALSFRSIKGKTGVDVYTKAYLEYPNAMSCGKSGIGVKSEGQLLISGTKGYILAPSPWWMTKKFEVRYEDPALKEEYDFEYEGSGLQYELKAFKEAVARGQSGHVWMKAEESIAMAGIFEQFLMERAGK